jgi:hypothetical protein
MPEGRRCLRFANCSGQVHLWRSLPLSPLRAMQRQDTRRCRGVWADERDPSAQTNARKQRALNGRQRLGQIHVCDRVQTRGAVTERCEVSLRAPGARARRIARSGRLTRARTGTSAERLTGPLHEQLRVSPSDVRELAEDSRDADPHAPGDPRETKDHTGEHEPDRVDDRHRPSHQPQRQALAKRRHVPSLDSRRHAPSRDPVPTDHRLPRPREARQRRRSRHQRQPSTHPHHEPGDPPASPSPCNHHTPTAATNFHDERDNL